MVIIKYRLDELDVKVVLEHLLHWAMLIRLEATFLESDVHLVRVEVKQPDLGAAGCTFRKGGFKAGCGRGLREVNRQLHALLGEAVASCICQWLKGPR
jgi:hypothetical protein